MASNQDRSLFQCTDCHQELNFESKTLPCLHSFCHSCLDRHFEGDTNENGQCPECHEPLTLDQLSLSPFVVKSLRRQQLESTDWKCDLCSVDGVEIIARNWFHDCEKLYCSSWHKKFRPKHIARDLDGVKRDEVIKAKMTDMCSLHQKAKDSYCEQCNVCVCDTCYQNHSADSPGCSSRPFSVRAEALKQISQGPSLAKKMDALKMSLRRLNEKTLNYTAELNSDCDSRCKQLWQTFEEMMEDAKRKTEELCEDMKQITAEQVKRWHHLLEENENTLKQLEIWRINLHHLLNESEQYVDVVCGLRSLRAKLSSRLQKSVGREEKCQLAVTFPDWWLQVLEQLKIQKIGSVSLTVEKLSVKNLGEMPAPKNLVFDKQWNLNRSDLNILLIYVGKEDNHVFLADTNTRSIIGFAEWGEFVCDCLLFDGTNTFFPSDMCSISPNTFVEGKHLFSWREEKFHHF